MKFFELRNLVLFTNNYENLVFLYIGNERILIRTFFRCPKNHNFL